MKQQYQSRPVQPQRPVNAQRGYIPKQPESSHTTDTALFAAAIVLLVIAAVLLLLALLPSYEESTQQSVTSGHTHVEARSGSVYSPSYSASQPVRNAPSPAQNTPEPQASRPGPSDLDDIWADIDYPDSDDYLDSYRTYYISAKNRGGSVYALHGLNDGGNWKKLAREVPDGTKVTAIAKHGFYSNDGVWTTYMCCLFSLNGHQRAGWINLDHLSA